MVEVSNKHKGITVGVSSNNGNTVVAASSDSATTVVAASSDAAQYWSQQARLSADSSKKSAQEAKNYAELANSYVEGFEGVVTNNTNNIIATSNDYINQITGTANTALTDIEDARVDAVDNITTVKSESIASVEAKSNEVLSTVNAGIVEINNTKTTILNDIEFVADGEKQEINELAEKAKDDIESTGVTSRADIDLSNLSNIGNNKFNTILNNKITNCLLEVPQRIKLELNNGVLTLKAGSELTYGDGRTIVIENDITQTCKVNATLNNLILIHELGTIGFGIYIQGNNAASGATPPTIGNATDYIWFDTNTNQMKLSHDKQVTWKEIPLPIGVVDITPYTYTNLKQVFNGMGYIGSTVWADKGVKCLMPNGRNEDGTLNNIEGSTQAVKISTVPSNLTNPSVKFVIDSAGGLQPNTGGVGCSGYIEVDEIPTSAIHNTTWLLHRPSNRVYQWDGTKYALKSASLVAVADISVSAGVITSFQPKQPFRAVDYNDFTNTPHITQTYVNGTSGYIIYSNKFCIQWGHVTLTSAGNGQACNLLKSFANTNYIVLLGFANNSGAYYGDATAGSHLTVGNKQTNLFKIAGSTANGLKEKDWLAIGYIA